MKLMKIDIDTLPEADASKFVITVNQHEFNLLNMALDEFRRQPLYDTHLKMGCSILVESMWSQSYMLS